MDGSDILTLWFVLAWLGLAILVGWSATQKGRDGGAWFFLSLVFSPFFTVLALIACPAVVSVPQETVALVGSAQETVAVESSARVLEKRYWQL